MQADRIEEVFPTLRGIYKITSPETDRYNCIAWAVYDTKQWWWPEPRYGCYWPPGVPRNNKLATLVMIFAMHGFKSCETAESEPGHEKVAIYVHPERGVQHAARQLSSGEWTSKLGDWEDIRHATPAALEGEEYGMVKQVMKRRRKEWEA